MDRLKDWSHETRPEARQQRTRCLPPARSPPALRIDKNSIDLLFAVPELVGHQGAIS